MMRAKTIHIIYALLLFFFVIMATIDAIGGLTQQKEGKEALEHLGYPLYLLTISGIAKLLGVIAVLQNKYHPVKEWAFAGFAFNFILAFWSKAYVGDSISLLIPPLIMFIYLMVTYVFWKKNEKRKIQVPL